MEHSAAPPAPMQVFTERVRTLRKLRGWSAERLAQEMTAVGVPWERMVVTKLETGKRQSVSVVELLALAVALDASPLALLLPHEPTGDGVQLTPNVVAGFQAAWRWATGDQPLIRHGDDKLRLDDPRSARFIHDNRPHEGPLVAEVSRFLISRLGGQPFTVDLRHDGDGTVRGGVRITSEGGNGGERQ